MEQPEVQEQQPEATPTGKQTFIYAKNPANAAKSITRKMRQSQAFPQPLVT